jgi:hypothetical protein
MPPYRGDQVWSRLLRSVMQIDLRPSLCTPLLAINSTMAEGWMTRALVIDDISLRQIHPRPPGY